MTTIHNTETCDCNQCYWANEMEKASLARRAAKRKSIIAQIKQLEAELDALDREYDRLEVREQC